MKYKDLIDKVDKMEKETELAECMYFGAIARLRGVQENLRILDDVQHVRRVIKPFLIQWGMMGRVVGRKGLAWTILGETLQSLEKEFGELRGKRFLLINFREGRISNAITKMYEKLDPIPYLGSPTTISKILHLLNPEMLVMWDNAIRKWYNMKDNRIRESPEGYLEFLKKVQKELNEALNERRRETGRALDDIEQEIRRKYKDKTLARIVDEYNWIAAHPSGLDF